ncbi:hypothetical protein C6503_20640 [Candidatus Poribacteria bacterium]|nr:MAG: hypothetical protein C6503_20640 [Candidatus Poribacteria bacterium]
MKTTRFSIFLTFILFSTVYLPLSVAQDYTTWHLPEGAKARLGKGNMPLHNKGASIQYSPDGTRLAIATNIGVWLYDAQSGEAIALLAKDTTFSQPSFNAAFSVAFSPDGKTLASAGWHINLWDVETGQHLETLHREVGAKPIVAFSPDGKTLASADATGNLLLWNLATGQVLRTHTKSVTSLAFSPDGQILASAGGRDNNIHLWDPTVRLKSFVEGQPLRTLEGHTDIVSSVSFSPNDQTLASSSADGTIRLWNLTTGQQDLKIESYNAGSISNVAFSPNGETLASTLWTVFLWDLPAVRELANEGVFLWDSGNIEKVLIPSTHPWDPPTPPPGVPNSVSFNPDGKTLVIGNNLGYVYLVDVSTRKSLKTLIGPASETVNIAFSPDGQTLASTSSDYINVWDVNTGQNLKRLDGPASSVAFSPDGRTLASAGNNYAIRLWDLAGITKSRYSFGGNATSHQWDVNIGQNREIPTEYPHAVTIVAFSPDGRTLASAGGGRDTNLQLWDVGALTQLRTLTGHTHLITSIAFSPDGLTLASAGNYFDKSIRLWHVPTGVQKQLLVGHTGLIANVAFSPDGRTLASAGWDRTIRLWDVSTGVQKQVLTGHADRVESVAFSPDGLTLASGGRDRTIRLWSGTALQHSQILTQQAGEVLSVAFSPDGRTLASGSADGTILLWPIMPAVDVNRDGAVNILDLVRVATNFGQMGAHAADVNKDGVVNIVDLVLVAGVLGDAAAPSAFPQVPVMLTPTKVQQWLTQAHQLNLTDAISQRGIRFLEQLLLALTPKETALLPNYPNPFNPETWIPYQLAAPAEVTLRIHAVDGSLVRVLSLGHKAIGIYQTRSRAAYWDGKNEVGEPVASGVYFYTLTAGDFTATRKMLIRK